MATNLISDEHAGKTLHVFEAAGLGKAPFRFVRFEVCKYQACPEAPVQPGSSCDYCGAAIMNVYWLRSADRRDFKVGCDCVEKTGDAGLRRAISQEQARIRREKSDAAAERACAELGALIADATVEAALSAEPHPVAFYAAQGLTRFQYAKWIYMNAGTSARRAMIKEIKQIGKK